MKLMDKVLTWLFDDTVERCDGDCGHFGDGGTACRMCTSDDPDQVCVRCLVDGNWMDCAEMEIDVDPGYPGEVADLGPADYEDDTL